MGAEYAYDNTGFGEVVYVFYYQLSKMSFLSTPFDYHVDIFYAMLNPDIDDNDEKYLTHLTSQASNDYAISFAKVKMISLILYKMNLLPRPALAKNLIHKEYLDLGRSGLDVGEKAIEFRRILNKHWIWMLMASSKGMNIDVHTDLLWAFIAPYVTQEDIVTWNGIARLVKKHGKRYAYQSTLEKVKLCSKIMDRSGLQFPRGMTDDGNTQWEVDRS